MQLLGAIIKNVQVRDFRDIDPDLILESGVERRVYDFIRRHHDTHRVLPDAEVIGENTGVVLPDTDQPVSYYMQRTRQRALFNQLATENGPYNRLQEALASPRTRMREMQDAIDEMYRVKMRFIDAGTGIETSDYLLGEVSRLAMEARMSDGTLSGITTGYEPVDQEMGGYNPGDLVVWVGRPGRSKSWKLLKQCHAAWNAGYKPLYISMEMGGVQNMRRLLGIHTGINPTHMKRGTIQTLALPYLERGIAELLEKRPLHMVTANFSRTVDQVANFIDEYTPDICYIDAGYLLSPRKKRYGSSGRRETISDVIEELKELSANSNIPFVITVQFNRQAEHRRRAGSGESFNPIAHLSLAEIGETDVIGQVATHVLGIEYPPPPLDQHRYRCFGFLKGREGESGWWLTNFIQSQSSPVDLSIIPRDDPVYEIIRQHAQRNRQETDGRRVDPAHRSALMRINRG
jgi:replicative DNA helicase